MLLNRNYYVYMMANKSHRVLYTGVTNNLERRVYEHKEKIISGFTKRYNVTKLVYYESCSDIIVAIAREKQIKGWVRKKKNALVSDLNLEWSDLSELWYRDSSQGSE